MITFAFDKVGIRSKADGSIDITFSLGELQPEQLGEIAKLFNTVGCIGITLEENFTNVEKEVLSKAIEQSGKGEEYRGIIRSNGI